jgi:hypothetical protein
LFYFFLFYLFIFFSDESAIDKGGGRILLGDKTAGGSGDAAADQVPVCWSLDLSGLPFACVCV